MHSSEPKMKNNEKEYLIYKGLQMPLVFKSFKGKYIYWGLGIFVGSFLVCAVITVATSISVGVTAMVSIIATGFFILSRKQKRGMHEKNNEKGIYIIQSTFKHFDNEQIQKI